MSDNHMLTLLFQSMVGAPVELADRSSDASKHFMGPKPRLIQVEKDPEVSIQVLSKLLPRARGKQLNSASLQMCILGGSQDPLLRVIIP